jgi:glycosyltransferase 2 family protein
VAAQMSNARSRRLRRTAVLGLGVASSLLFLTLVLRRADPRLAWDALLEANIWLVTIACIAIQLVYVGQALRWRVIAGLAASLLRYLGLVLAGVGVNNLLPLRLGDILRARWLARSERVPTGRVLASVFRDRIADVVTLVLMLVVTLPLVGGAAWVVRLAIAGIALVVALAATVAAALVYTRYRPRHRIAVRSPLRSLVRDVLDELSSRLNRRRVTLALLLSIAAWSTWAVAAWFVAASLGIDLSAEDVVFVTAVMNLGVAIPSSPGFVGTYQWLGVSALGLVGVAPDVALAFAFLMQAIWFVPTTVVGGGLALRELHNDRLRSERGPNSIVDSV